MAKVEYPCSSKLIPDPFAIKAPRVLLYDTVPFMADAIDCNTTRISRRLAGVAANRTSYAFGKCVLNEGDPKEIEARDDLR